MASIFITSLLMFLITILNVQYNLIISVHAQKVPCFFLFGDSLFDNGNNNVLITSAKVNYYPYGIDYLGGQATGRFANGENIPDYLAQSLGFDRPISPFVSVRVSDDIIRGANYASGLAGILEETGSAGGDRFTFNKQLSNHADTIARIANRLGDSNRAKLHLSQCLYALNFGSNDYLNNYLQPQNYNSSSLYTPEKFADLLIRTYCEKLKNLYEDGARRVAVFAIGLLGCIPREIARYDTLGAPCVGFINDYVTLFNDKLKALVDDLNRSLSGARFTVVNLPSLSSSLDPLSLGIRVLNAPCCVTNRETGLCIKGLNPCNNRSEYAFWDDYHPTSLIDRVTAARAYTALLPTDVYPVDISHLIAK